jgi:hypothetical protein
MKTEALKLADELDELHQYVPSEAPAMIRRLVEELDKQSKPVGVYDGKSLHIYTPQTKPFNEEEFNAIAYSYRSWPAHDPKGVSDRYQELLNYLERHGIK